MNPFKHIPVFFRASRSPFLIASAGPFLAGSSIGYWKTNQFDFVSFILGLTGVLFLHAGSNLANDYFDHLSGNDWKNRFSNPFSGGSRFIQNGELPPEYFLHSSFISFFLAALTAILLFFRLAIFSGNSWTVILLALAGLTGLFLGFFYTAPPFKFSYRGLGEVTLFITFGPLLVSGAFLTQSYMFPPAINSLIPVIFLSFPSGLFVTQVLFVNQFPDEESDRLAGKKTLVVLLGTEKAAWLNLFLTVTLYISIALLVLLNAAPGSFLLTFLALPFSLYQAKIVLKKHKFPSELVPASRNAILAMAAGTFSQAVAFFLA